MHAHEVTCATILLQGAFPVVLMATFSAFFAGRGQTRVILVVNVVATAVNFVLDLSGSSERGFFGAGVAATVSARCRR